MSSINTLLLDETGTPGQRLLFAIKYSDMTQRKYARLIGISPNGLNQIVKGKNRLSKTMALAAELITGVRADWILNNELPIDLDPISKIEPWDRIVLEFYRPNDMNIFERVFGEIEQQTSPFRNSIDQEIAWTKKQNDQYQVLIKEAKELLQYFTKLDTDQGQGPFRLGLMILHGKFSKDELENSEASGNTDTDLNESIERIWAIRNELDNLINKPNTKGD